MRIFSNNLNCIVIATVTICIMAGCSTVSSRKESSQPEPVMAIYRVKRGAEAELEGVLKRTWEMYRRERMVLDKPHIFFRIKEADENIQFVEVFEWVGPFATEYPPVAVKKLGDETQALCEERGGHPGVEFREGELVGNR